MDSENCTIMNSSEEEAIESLHMYCVALEEFQLVAVKYISHEQERKSLRQILVELASQDKQPVGGRYAVLEDNIPDALKCPVCFEVYCSEVLQCCNGHSICLHCSNTLLECPECRVSYTQVKIRNRSLEQLLSTLKIDCIYNEVGCRMKQVCSEMQVHVETCRFMNKPVRSEEYKQIRKQVKHLDGSLKRLEKQLGQANATLITKKSIWKKTLNSSSLMVVVTANELNLSDREQRVTELYSQLAEFLIS